MPPDCGVDDFSDRDVRIDTREKQVVELCGKMESLQQEFVKATTAALTSWYKAVTAATARSAPEHTQELGREGLEDLKRGLRDLINKAPAVVEQHLSDRTLWEHLHKSPGQSQPRNLNLYSRAHPPGAGFDRPPALVPAMRNVSAGLAPLLLAHGYGVHSDSEFVQRTSVLAWSAEMCQTIDLYQVAYVELCTVGEALAKDKRAKAEAEAQALWDATGDA
jgi:hypothetical protein